MKAYLIYAYFSFLVASLSLYRLDLVLAESFALDYFLKALKDCLISSIMAFFAYYLANYLALILACIYANFLALAAVDFLTDLVICLTLDLVR